MEVVFICEKRLMAIGLLVGVLFLEPIVSMVLIEYSDYGHVFEGR